MDYDYVYDEDYYIHGLTTGKSLYENYRYLGQPTLDMAKQIVQHVGITNVNRILDFGAARGYLVRALREQGYSAWGCDISAWAIENADEKARDYLNHGKPRAQYDWVIAKDVLEHLDDGELGMTIDDLMERTRIGLFIVVPLSATDGAPYVVADYEKDYTHEQRLTIGTWIQKLLRPGWKVEAQYLVQGVKENYAKFATGNGFITLRRILPISKPVSQMRFLK